VPIKVEPQAADTAPPGPIQVQVEKMSAADWLDLDPSRLPDDVREVRDDAVEDIIADLVDKARISSETRKTQCELIGTTSQFTVLPVKMVERKARDADRPRGENPDDNQASSSSARPMEGITEEPEVTITKAGFPASWLTVVPTTAVRSGGRVACHACEKISRPGLTICMGWPSWPPGHRTGG